MTSRWAALVMMEPNRKEVRLGEEDGLSSRKRVQHSELDIN